MKKSILFFCLIFFLFSVNVSAESTLLRDVDINTIVNISHPNVEKFIKGNLKDKTEAVRESSGNEAVWLCDKAISFVIESKQVLNDDRELDGLAVAAVLSFPNDFVRNAGENVREIIVKEYVNVFDSFNSSPNVQITVISKMNTLSKELDLLPFVKSLNKMLSSNNIYDIDISVIKSAVNFLSLYGNNESFICAYNLWNSRGFESIKSEVETMLISLLPVSMNEAVAITKSPSLERVSSFFNLVNTNKSKIFENSFCELAENVLFNTILLVRKNQKSIAGVTEVQIECVKVLSESKWTRASSVVLEYFEYTKNLFESDTNMISESDFVTVINALSDTSPFESVPALIDYLGTLNARVEKFEDVSNEVALAVINTLGAIGDKTAFDTLLGVTYFAYPQEVLSAARDALSGLKW